MATDKRLDQVNLATEAESVLVVNGDKVEKATLAGFANSMGNAVPTQQTSEQVSITGLYARTTDGKMVELTKESVASVMKELIPLATLSSNGLEASYNFYNRKYAENNYIDFNEIIEQGVYRCGAQTINRPKDSNQYGVLFVDVVHGYTVQTYCGNNGTTHSRVSTSGKNWNNWSRVDNFGYNTLAELSSAVAGQMQTSNLFPFAVRDSKQDANECVASGIYHSILMNNMPFNYGILIVFSDSAYIFQIAVSVTEHKYYLRYKNEAEWGSWCNISVNG